MNIRLLAARSVLEVSEGRSLPEVLASRLSNVSDSRDKAFLQALCYGVCRYYIKLDVILSHLLQKPMNAKDADVHALLLVGLYQLMDMRVPSHAAVSETVNAAKKINKPWAVNFVNGVLRQYLREKDNIEQALANDEEGFYAFPEWWIEEVKSAWPQQWQMVLENSNQHPPFVLRVNQQKITRQAYLEKVKAQVIPETNGGILLEQASAVESLPGFHQGHISVQDGAAQLAAELFDFKAKQRVLDACSAPGGKLNHMLECEPSLEATAVEKDKMRLTMVKENLARLGQHAKLIHADAGELATWWDGHLFDFILLDAPCSASGVVRRHPDIKLLRQPDDLEQLAKEQAHLLQALWPLLKAQGTLLYATCSVFPQENVEIVKAFLKQYPDAKEEKIQAAWGIEQEVGRQILPGMHNMDGFYYARLKKVSSY